MNRRRFLQGLPATAAACSVAPAFPGQMLAAQERDAIVYVSPGAINGAVARALMPPTGEPPLPQSSHFKGLRFTGKQRNYQETVNADTWYPGWAADGTLYSSYTDGTVKDAAGRLVRSGSLWLPPSGFHERWFRDLGVGVADGRITSESTNSPPAATPR